MTGEDAAPVIHNGESCVQVGVVAEHVLHDVILELIVEEERIVWLKEDIGTVLVLCLLGLVTGHLTFLEGSLAHHAIAITAYLEVTAQRIDGLHADTIQTHGLLKSLRVVLTTSIQHGYGLDHLSLWDASPIVSDRNTQVVVNSHLDTVARFHLEFIDGVVDNLFQQHVDTIFGQGAVAQTTDIHTRTSTYMLHITQMTDVLVIILYLFLGG